jgi:DNA-binding response OmpR family regulator
MNGASAHMSDFAATRILLVSEDASLFVSIGQLLVDTIPRYALSWTPHYAEGLQRLLRGEADAALIDSRLTGSGLDLIREALANNSGVPLIILTGTADEAVERRAMDIGAADYLRRPQLTRELLDRTLRWTLRHQEMLTRLRRAEADSIIAPLPIVGSKTVFVVDDQPQVRSVICESLRRHGYTVLEAGDTEAAITIGREHHGPIHVLVADLSLPKTSGRLLAHHLLVERPGLRIIYTSGHGDDVLALHGVLEPGLALLRKPFTPEALLRKLREVME